MNQQNRSLILFVLAIVGFLVVLGVGIYVTLQQQNQTENAPFTPSTDTPAEVSEPQDQGVTASLYIQNLSVLSRWFSEIEYLFINDSIINYGHQNFPEADGFVIDETSLTQESATKYNFTIRDPNKARLFFVSITRTPEGQLNINFFNS